MDLLFAGVANHNGVAVAVVRQYCLVRNATADSAVILSFGLFYVLIGYFVAVGLVRRFPSDEPLAAVLVVVVICGYEGGFHTSKLVSLPSDVAVH